MLKKHLANRHSIGIIWHQCDRCDFKSKTTQTLVKHKAKVHLIGAKWHFCDKCDYKTLDTPIIYSNDLEETLDIAERLDRNPQRKNKFNFRREDWLTNPPRLMSEEEFKNYALIRDDEYNWPVDQLEYHSTVIHNPNDIIEVDWYPDLRKKRREDRKKKYLIVKRPIFRVCFKETYLKGIAPLRGSDFQWSELYIGDTFRSRNTAVEKGVSLNTSYKALRDEFDDPADKIMVLISHPPELKIIHDKKTHLLMQPTFSIDGDAEKLKFEKLLSETVWRVVDDVFDGLDFDLNLSKVLKSEYVEYYKRFA